MKYFDHLKDFRFQILFLRDFVRKGLSEPDRVQTVWVAKVCIGSYRTDWVILNQEILTKNFEKF